MTAKRNKPRLGSDPFAALGLLPDGGEEAGAPSKPSPTAKTPTKRPATATAPRAAKATPRPRAAKTAPSAPRPAPMPPPAVTAVPPPPPIDVARLEDRLTEAFEHLRAMPLPDGPPQRGLIDEFYHLARRTLQLISPIFYYRLYNEMVFSGRSFNVDPFGLDSRFEERAEQLANFFYRKWWRVSALGVDHIPAGGRTLLVANHSGMLPYDGAMIKHAVRLNHPARRTVRFLVENFIFYFPFLGTLVYRYGGVRASMENALRLLEDDQLTAVFPEGVKGLSKHYRHRYQLQRFGRGGFIKLALQARAPIIPVAVIGAEEIHPILGHANFLAKPLRLPYVPMTPTFPWLGPLGLVPLPSKWTIVFGDPMTFPLEYGPAEADNEILVHELTLRVRRQIHEQIYDQLAARKSVFFG